jgi:dTDP-4-amino-4,6-dideoxygalactose transaminase
MTSDGAVAYVNLRRFDERFGGEVREAIARVLASGVLIGGPEVERFEADFAAYCGAAHAVGVASGTDALELTLRAWEIGPGDDVLVPANTAIPTALAVSHAGARPVLVDVERDSGLMRIELAEAAITPATRAIVPVHLYGHPVDLDDFRALAARHGLRLLDDCAHAHGARYRGARAGAGTDASAWSFYPTKNLGALGDGGCVTTGDARLAEALRLLRNLGITPGSVHTVRGFTSRLDPLQAAVLRWKLAHLEEWNARRGELAALYLAELADTAGLALPAVRPWAVPVWHAFPVLVHGGRRDDVRDALARDGITTNVHYPVPVHLQPCYADLGLRRGDFPASEERAAAQLSLPLDPFHTEGEIRRVARALRAALRRAPVRSA